jgi:hypothetical protein
MISPRPLRMLATVMVPGFFALLFAALLGCGITVNDQDKKNPKVDIQTPMGSLKVDTQVDPKDIGLAVYPGATPYSESGEEGHGRANVNISSSMFGVKVIAAKFKTDDSPEKVLQFYRKEMDSMGKVIECPNGVDADVKGDNPSDWQQDVRCRTKPEPGRTSGEVDLAVGTKDHHHLVNVKPLDKGCRFALVYVETRGQRQTM